MGSYDFQKQLAFSRGIRENTDVETLKKIIFGCQDVIKAGIELDKKGIDYIATLRGGAQVFIDAKSREKGCSRFWKPSPELALEVWSVMPGGKYNTPKERQKVGWTLDESKLTDLVLFTYDISDTAECFLFPFQHLRMAFRHFYYDWTKRYKTDTQDSNRWESKCVFVPYDIVLDAISFISRYEPPPIKTEEKIREEPIKAVSTHDNQLTFDGFVQPRLFADYN